MSIDVQPTANGAALSGLPSFPVEHYETYQSRVVEQWIEPGWRVLEIGCSAGYFTPRLEARGAIVTGLDLNFNMVTRANAAFPQAQFCVADAERLPFAKEWFDAVVMLEVIEHVGSEPPVLAEIRRVLRPGGMLFLSTPHAGVFAFLDPFNVKTFFMRNYPGLSAAAGRLQRYNSPQLTSNMQVHRHYSLAKMKALLGRGFSIVHLHRGGLLLFPVCSAGYSVLSRVAPLPILRRLCYRLMAMDARLNYGSWSYNLMLIAVRQAEPRPVRIVPERELVEADAVGVGGD